MDLAEGVVLVLRVGEDLGEETVGREVVRELVDEVGVTRRTQHWE